MDPVAWVRVSEARLADGFGKEGTFSGMGRSLGGKLAFLVMTGLNAAQQSATVTFKAWCFALTTVSYMTKNTYLKRGMDLMERIETLACSIIIHYLAMGN